MPVQLPPKRPYEPFITGEPLPPEAVRENWAPTKPAPMTLREALDWADVGSHTRTIPDDIIQTLAAEVRRLQTLPIHTPTAPVLNYIRDRRTNIRAFFGATYPAYDSPRAVLEEFEKMENWILSGCPRIKE